MIGIDIIEIERIEAAAKRHPRILERLFTRRELHSAKRQREPWCFYAGRFAAKEAVAKALRTSLPWHEVEILAAGNGAPTVSLGPRALEALSSSGSDAVSVSISHCREYAAAVAMLHRKTDAGSMQAPQA